MQKATQEQRCADQKIISPACIWHARHSFPDILYMIIISLSPHY